MELCIMSQNYTIGEKNNYYAHTIIIHQNFILYTIYFLAVPYQFQRQLITIKKMQVYNRQIK